MNEPRESIRSPNALRVFESAARCLSFTVAASELHVTQVAVSRMVARLEDSVGVRLFIRHRNGLQLTEDGAILFASVSDGFSKMQAGLRELRRRRTSRNTVTLSLSSGFTSHWLMPRYSKFQEAVPGINLRFQLTDSILHGDVDEVDLGMRMYSPAQHLQSWSFCPEIVVPLCSPEYLARMGSFKEAADSGNHTLIHLTTTTMDWDGYCSRSGLKHSRQGNSLSFSDYALVIQAALLGQGVGLGWVSVVSGVVRSGLLVPASAYVVRTGKEYRLVARNGPLGAEVCNVRDWLIAEMEDDLKSIGTRYSFLAGGYLP